MGQGWRKLRGVLVTWAMPLRLHLSVIILGLLACTSLPLIFITYTQGKFAALSTGEAQMRQLGLRVIEDYRNVFREGYSAIVAASAVPEMTTPPPYDVDTKEAFLLNVLRSSFRVDNLYAGYPDGSYVQVVDAAGNSEWRADVNAPTGAAYAVRTIDRSNGGPNTVWTFYGKDMQLLRRVPIATIFSIHALGPGTRLPSAPARRSPSAPISPHQPIS